MMMIRMLKNAAGPNLNLRVNESLTVDDATGQMYIDAGAAELIATVDQSPDLTVHVDSDEIETAAIDPVIETADAPKPTRKRAAA